MKKTLIAFLGFAMLSLAGTAAQAGCTGGVGSVDLACTSNANTLIDFKTWVETSYVPMAIDKAMTAFADARDIRGNLVGSGESQVADEWGKDNRSIFVSAFGLKDAPWWVSNETRTNKSLSDFFIDGFSHPQNGANVWLELKWTGTVAQTINGVTNYIGSYTYKFHGDAWGVHLVDNVLAWLPTQHVEGNGTGTYNFTTRNTAVPGPEAGAGLGAMAMAGIGAYAVRRRRASAAA